jgi:hypothetical protein
VGVGVALALAVTGAACDDPGTAPEQQGVQEMSGRSDGPELLAPSARADEVIAAAMAAPGEGGPVRWIAIAEAARRGDPGAVERLASLRPEAFAASWAELDGYQDTADFDLLYLMNLRLGYAELLPPEVVAAVDQRILDFKYWYTDATPGVVDHRWYWSENHRIIFHTLELLAGQLFEERTFSVPAEDGTPFTGVDHQRRASEMIDAWIREKAAYGFSEWHSDVYYQKDLTPLLTLAEHAEDPLISARATVMVDLVLFDLALHQVDGNVGVTHGRSYAKDKLRAADQDTFGALQVLFGLSGQAPSPEDAGAVLFARAQRYRVPEVLEAVARSTSEMQDCEHMGVAIDPHEPLADDPVRGDGLSYTDPAMVPFWWERSALTPWQTVGLTMDTADRYHLWDTELFSQFEVVQDVTGGDRDVARDLAASFAPMINIGLLGEVDTCTWRSGGVMLSSAIDYRPGELGHQYHAWQATLGEDAVVFTTSPGNEPRPGERWPDGDLYWNGGVQPRSLQVGPAAIHVYRPGYLRPGPGLLEDFDYLPLTHAYLPGEHFDELRQEGGWTFARVGARYVGLWSHRPTSWRDHTGDGTPTGGLTEPFDLVAEGGADNVWVVEVGRGGSDGEGPEGEVGRWADFEQFVDALVAATPEVVQGPPTADGLAGELSVRYESPGAGELEVSGEGEVRVDGEAWSPPSELRFDNPFSRAEVGDTSYRIEADGRLLQIDLLTGERSG